MAEGERNRRRRFLLVYGGNVGAAAGVEELIESFAGLDAPNLQLLVAGEGSNLERCEEIADDVAPGRVLFHHPWTAEQTGTVLATADLLVLPTRGSQSAVSVPSKLISYLLAERPVLVLAEAGSETASVVRSAGAGWVVEPANDEQFAEAVTQAMDLSAAERATLGRNGRDYAVEHFSRRLCLPRVVEIVREAK